MWHQIPFSLNVREYPRKFQFVLFWNLFVSAATHDVKRDIYDLSINKYGSQIAIVENQGDYESVQESAVRIYSVGRRKNMEDEAEEDDDDMAMSDDGSSDNDSVGMYHGNIYKCLAIFYTKIKVTPLPSSSQTKRDNSQLSRCIWIVSTCQNVTNSLKLHINASVYWTDMLTLRKKKQTSYDKKKTIAPQ